MNPPAPPSLEDLTREMRAVRAPRIEPRLRRSPALPIALVTTFAASAVIAGIALSPAKATARTWGEITQNTRSAPIIRTRALIDGAISTETTTAAGKSQRIFFDGRNPTMEIRFDGERTLMWQEAPKNRDGSLRQPAAFAYSLVQKGRGELGNAGKIGVDGVVLLKDLLSKKDVVLINARETKGGGQAIKAELELYGKRRQVDITTDGEGRIHTLRYPDPHVRSIELQLNYLDGPIEDRFRTDRAIRGSLLLDDEELHRSFRDAVQNGLGSKDGVTLRAVVASSKGDVLVFWSSDAWKADGVALLGGFGAKPKPNPLLRFWDEGTPSMRNLRDRLKKAGRLPEPVSVPWKRGELHSSLLVPSRRLPAEVSVQITTSGRTVEFSGIRPILVGSTGWLGKELGYDLSF